MDQSVVLEVYAKHGGNEKIKEKHSTTTSLESCLSNLGTQYFKTRTPAEVLPDKSTRRGRTR